MQQLLEQTSNRGIRYLRDLPDQPVFPQSGAMEELPKLDQNEERQPCHFTPEMSCRARGIEVWAAAKL